MKKRVTIEAELSARVDDRIAELVTIARERAGFEIRTPVVYYYDGTLTAGYAKYSKNSVGLHATFLRENTRNMIEETVAHEVAHLVVFQLWIAGRITEKQRRRAHGPVWRGIMRNWFAVTPERCHNFSTENVTVRRQRRWEARCECRSFWLSTTVRNKMRRGQKRHCVKCRSSVYLTGREA